MVANPQIDLLKAEIERRLTGVRERIARAAEKAGIDSKRIKIVAVTKTFPAEAIRALSLCGLKAIGENRVQEALDKMAHLGDLPEIEWHLIGHLQTNKVRKVVGKFALIQSVDSLHLAQKINDVAAELQTSASVLIEINTSGESSKFGVTPEGLYEMIAQLSNCQNLRINGLMTVGPLTANPVKIGRAFALLRQLFEGLKGLRQSNLEPRWLSMGMTDDFEIAVAEGANMLRLGRALLGERR